MSVYTYARSSEIEELESREDVDRQLEQESLKLQTYALGKGIKVDQSVHDTNQKWTTDFSDRPLGEWLLNKVQEGDILLVNTIERIFSSCEDMKRTVKVLKRRGVSLVILELGGDVCDDSFHVPFPNMMNIFHNLEKRRSTERIKTVKQSQRKKGRFLGGSRPFGYMIHSNGRLIENPMEQKVLKKIIAMKKQGKSLRAISSEVSTPMVPVSFKTVQRLIKRHEENSSPLL